MMMNKREHQTYETPEVEVIEIELENSIAASGDRKGAAFWEELWG